MARVNVHLDDDTYFLLMSEKVNVSKYVRNLILLDMNSKEQKQFQKYAAKQNAKILREEMIEELRILGAVGNVIDRITRMSKMDKAVEFALCKRSIRLLEAQKEIVNTQDTKDIIEAKIIQIKKRFGIDKK